MTIKEFLLEKGFLTNFINNVRKIVPLQIQENILNNLINKEGYELEKCFPFAFTNEGSEFWSALKREYDFQRHTCSTEDKSWKKIDYNINSQYISDAPHYLYGAKLAVNSMLRQSEIFKSFLNEKITQARYLAVKSPLSFNELVQLTSEYTYENLIHEGNVWNDLNAVGWEMGKLCYIYTESLHIAKGEYDKLFLQSWKHYFQNYNM